MPTDLIFTKITRRFLYPGVAGPAESERQPQIHNSKYGMDHNGYPEYPPYITVKPVITLVKAELH